MRFLRRGLAALIGAVLLWVVADYLRSWRDRARVVQRATRILSSDVIRSADSIEYSENEEGKLRFKIRASKLLETRQGKSLLEGIEAFDFNPDGSPRNHIRSLRAEYDREGGQALFIGDVRIQMGKDIELRAASLFYSLKDDAGRTDDTMYLSSPRARGQARGVRYDNARRILELKDETDLEVTRTASREGRPVTQERSRITSKSLYYSEADRFVVFQGNARLESADSSLAGTSIEARLSEDRRHIHSLMCEGNAEYQATRAGQKQVLLGDRIDFGMSSALSSLETVTVNGNARFSSEGEGMQHTLRGSRIRLDLDPADGSLRRLNSSSGVRFENKRGESSTAISGEELEADFSQETKLLKDMRVRQGARLSMDTGAGQSSDELAADQIRIEFAPIAGQSRPSRLHAEGSARWTSPPRESGSRGKGSSGRVLTAERLEMRYGPSGESLEQGSASGDVHIAVLPGPAESSPPVRSLRAERVQFSFFESGNKLKTLDGENQVRVSYRAPRKANVAEEKTEAFETTSRHLHAAFRATDGAMESVSQWGDFAYNDGVRTATSGRSDYLAQDETLLLTESPQVVDSAGRTTGNTLEYKIKEKLVVVRGSVRSAILPSNQSRGDSPFMSSSGSETPTVVTADQMKYWTEASRFEYSGRVTMLSEGGQLRARTVDVIDSGGELTASGDVLHVIDRRTRSVQAREPAKPDTAEHRDASNQKETPIQVRCQNLKYNKGRNSINYEGKVALESGTIRMWSDRLDATLDAEGRRIDWAKATGNLRILQAGRQADGDQADYFLKPGKVVVVGAPAKISDPERGRSAARRLTFFTSDDRILLEKS